jgi:hypothetical protein
MALFLKGVFEMTKGKRIPIQTVSQAMWCNLPLKVRITAGAALGHRVLQLYSQAFRDTYQQDSTLDLIWRFVEGEQFSESALKRAIDECDWIYEKANSQKYDLYEVCIPHALLFEVRDADGKGVDCAMAGVATAYWSQVLYHHHLAAADSRVAKLYGDFHTTQKLVWQITRKVYRNAKDLTVEGISRESFSWIEFPNPGDSSLLSDAFRKVAKKPSRPELIPEHERNKQDEWPFPERA